MNNGRTSTLQIDYSSFIRLCRVNDPNDWIPGFVVKTDGIWVVPPPDNALLYPGERAELSKQPLRHKKDLAEPALSFPCSLQNLQAFLELSGGYGCIDPFDIADFLLEETTGKAEAVNLDELPPSLKVAILVYREFWKDRPKDTNPASCSTISAFVQKSLNSSSVSKAEIDRITTIARPPHEKGGGAPQTDRDTFKGHSAIQTTKKTPH